MQQALSSLFQSTENSQSGTTENDGAQGDQSGSVEGAEEAVGGEGNSSDGYELGNRKAIRKPKPKYVCNETGRVVIRVWVNAEGETYKAELDLKIPQILSLFGKRSQSCRLKNKLACR
ncbi:MAG: hypothetical protein CM15mP23_12160 [Cryomorphaceae bacterium]|nr:MAG: hypothetical protein CM15mP23_12160 [Cryomorphaceae bacterium]